MQTSESISDYPPSVIKFCMRRSNTLTYLFRNQSLTLQDSISHTQSQFTRLISLGGDQYLLNEFNDCTSEFYRVAQKQGTIRVTKESKVDYIVDEITLNISYLRDQGFVQVTLSKIRLRRGNNFKDILHTKLLGMDQTMISSGLSLEGFLLLVFQNYVFIFAMKALELTHYGIHHESELVVCLRKLNDYDCVLCQTVMKLSIYRIKGGQFEVVNTFDLCEMMYTYSYKIQVNFTDYTLTVVTLKYWNKMLIILTTNDQSVQFNCMYEYLENVSPIAVTMINETDNLYILLIHTTSEFKTIEIRKKAVSQDISSEPITSLLKIQTRTIIVNYNYNSYQQPNQNVLMLVDIGTLIEIQSENIYKWLFNSDDGFITQSQQIEGIIQFQEPCYALQIRALSNYTQVDILNLNDRSVIGGQLLFPNDLQEWTLYYASKMNCLICYRSDRKYRIAENEQIITAAQTLIKFICFEDKFLQFNSDAFEVTEGKNILECQIKDMALQDIQNIECNVFIALDERQVVVFALTKTAVHMLMRFGVLNEERLLFRNQLSLEDLEQMDFADDHPMLPITYLKAYTSFRPPYSPQQEFQALALIQNGETCRIVTISFPSRSHTYTKEHKLNITIDHLVYTRDEVLYIMGNKQEVYKATAKNSSLEIIIHYIASEDLLLYGTLSHLDDVDIIIKASRVCHITRKGAPNEILKQINI